MKVIIIHKYFIPITYKAVSRRIDCFFRTQKGVIDLCVRFGTKDTVSEPATSRIATTDRKRRNSYY